MLLLQKHMDDVCYCMLLFSPSTYIAEASIYWHKTVAIVLIGTFWTDIYN